MSSGDWDIEKIITHEFPIDDISQAIETALTVSAAFFVMYALQAFIYDGLHTVFRYIFLF